MGTLVPLSLQSSFRSLIMDLYRYMMPMFLIILCCNIFPTKEEKTKEQEHEREENLNLGSNIQEKEMDRQIRPLSPGKSCSIFFTFDQYFCKTDIHYDMDTRYTRGSFCSMIRSILETSCEYGDNRELII